MSVTSKFTRRDFIKVMAAISAQFTFLSVGGALYGTKIEPAWVEIKSMTLELPRLHPAFDGFRFTQISDIHMGGWMNRERFQHVVELVKGTNPELILITGDFIESTPSFDQVLESVQDVKDVLTSLNSVPSLAILGNQDYRSGADLSLRAELPMLGIIDLTNRVHTISRGGGNLHFGGLDDILMGFPDLDKVLSELPNDGSAILLAHEPDFADTSSATGRFDLQISGHSHGGQVVFPVLGPPILPSLGQKYFSGLYKVGTMLQYTNRGVGTTQPHIRINCRPEITVFTLKAG
jgi:uncharacterized protein